VIGRHLYAFLNRMWCTAYRMVFSLIYQ